MNQTCENDGRHRKLIVVGAYDSVKECMDNHVYARERIRIRQVR